MYPKLVLCLCLILFSAVMVEAKDTNQEKSSETNKQSEAKELSGMSIVGNEETPKALYIVPWKSSELGGETSMDMMLNENDGPVDRDVFKRQIDFYKVRTKK